MKKKTALIVSLALIIVCLIGGTIAWLMDSTDTITNTFTIGKVDIDLTETVPDDREAQMTPGSEIAKDPTVSVTSDSEACYVYIKIDDEASDYLTWDIADGWTELSGETGVYYRTVAKGEGTDYPVLKDNKVTVKDTVTSVTGTPTLAFTAYAIQSENIDDAAAGWTALNE